MYIDRIYPIIALALLAAVTLWIERVTRAPAETPRIDRSDPDFIGERIRMTAYNTEGQPRYELIAERIVHYPMSDVTDFEQPRLRYQSSEGDIRIRADNGESGPSVERVLLHGDVVVTREAIGENPPLSLETATLTLWPDTQRAMTDAPVVLKHGNIVANGNGLRADNLVGTFDLVGDTRVQMPSSKRNRP